MAERVSGEQLDQWNVNFLITKLELLRNKSGLSIRE